MEIVSREGKPLFSSDATTLRAAVIEAVKARANLAGADLEGADLEGAFNLDPTAPREEPKEPYIRKMATRAERAQRYRERHPDVPVVEDLDTKILEAITTGGGRLDMGSWHSCETTHCRAGWAIHLAGKAGYELEAKLGSPEFAGCAIYRASTGRSPHFFASNEAALTDIKRCAEEDPLPAPEASS